MRVTAGLDSGPVGAGRGGRGRARGRLRVASRRGSPSSAASCWCGPWTASSGGSSSSPSRTRPRPPTPRRSRPRSAICSPSRPAAELERTVRALTPHVGAYLELEGGSASASRRPAPCRTVPAAGAIEARGGQLVVGSSDGGAAPRGRPAARKEADERGRFPAWTRPARQRPSNARYPRHMAERVDSGTGEMAGAPDAERGRPPAPELPGLRRALAAPRPAPGALRLRLLPAPLRARLAVPQLRRAPDDQPPEPHRGHEVPGLRRTRCCARSDLGSRHRYRLDGRARALRDQAGRALDPLVRLLPARLAGRGGDGRRRADHPRRRDGRPLRPADHDRPARRGLDRRPRPRCGRRDRRPPDDRTARPAHRGVRQGGRGLHHLPRRGDPAHQPHAERDPRARLPGGARDQPRHPGLGGRASR